MVGGRGPGVVGGPMCGSDIEFLGKGWPMKSLVFPAISLTTDTKHSRSDFQYCSH